MYRDIKGAIYNKQGYELFWRIYTRKENEDNSSCDEVDDRAAEQNISVFLYSVNWQLSNLYLK